MRLEDLVLRIPGDEFRVRFHEQLTVLSGIGMLERQALADSLVGALIGTTENSVVTYTDRTGRRVEISSSGGIAASRYLDDDSPALPIVGTLAPNADALRALMSLQAGDLGLTSSQARADDHPELAEARATLQALAKELKAATSGRQEKDDLRAELTQISAQIRQAEDGTARREYAGVLANLERVRAEAAALQSGHPGAETDQHLLNSAERTRDLTSRWKVAAELVTRLVCHTPAERLDPVRLSELRWIPDNEPSNLHALFDELTNARRDRDRLDSCLRDLATSKLPDPSDPRVIDLATVDQTELWRAATEVVDASRALSREQVALGGTSSTRPTIDGADRATVDVIARVEDSHRVVEDLEAQSDKRRVPAIAGAAIVAVVAILFAPASALVAIGLLVGASSAAFFGIGRPMRQLAAARQQEALALADVDAPTYLGFHIRRVEASMTPGAHDRLEASNEEHRAALTRWHDLAGTVSVETARQLESEVRAYAGALAQLGSTAGELESMRIELTDRAEPAVARARSALVETCAAYALDDVTVETADAALLERLVLEQVELGRVARAQEELKAAEVDEEKLATQLDDVLHHLGFRDGTLDARSGALDWAVERASERQEARRRARSRTEIEDDLVRLQNESRRLRRPEWATVQASDAAGPNLEELLARQAAVRAALDQERTEIDPERLADRHSAMERRVAALETKLDHDHPESTIAQVADVQQYLLAHLTKSAHCGLNDESLPVVLDEPFVRIAADRKWELLDMLRRLGENTQLIYLTDDPFVGAWARRRASAGLITLMEPIDA
jgi:hypothetical protein